MRSRFFALDLFSVAGIHPALARQFELAAASGDGPPAVGAEQIDAWRDHTGALKAVLALPRPDHGPGGSGEREPDAGAAGAESNADARDPFAFQERLVDDLTRRAASAGRLKDAIAALRTKLTPEQLEILASAERPQGPPPGGPLDNPPGDAAGPRGLPSPGRQLPPPPTPDR